MYKDQFSSRIYVAKQTLDLGIFVGYVRVYLSEYLFSDFYGIVRLERVVWIA